MRKAARVLDRIQALRYLSYRSREALSQLRWSRSGRHRRRAVIRRLREAREYSEAYWFWERIGK